MDVVQQQILDSYRAAQHGEAPPPLPGRHDRAVLRELRGHLRGRLRARLAAGPGPPSKSRPRAGRGRPRG
ncbi:hypothetical protein OG909_13155 [Streptomyces sp. NBC_01754]|uniref:hypothetical protein n=1 Tax=Streptomyces sp. NBC_01754 TaxID=2975930 RepID=UPI002DD91E40|nr:hypothetical protein [Streptomyces sp. NBC_01754]WSC93165.1 hypothetical protein OG909_13155 [Streptomyces sp. NBC_01754]